MAPREATGAFPDQYLAFDFDVTAGGGVLPPPQHNPVPVAAVGTQTQPPPTTNSAPVSEGNHVATGIQSTGDYQNTSVDPLSIDPTLHQTSWTSTVNSSSNVLSTTSARPLVSPVGTTSPSNNANFRHGGGVELFQPTLPRQISQGPTDFGQTGSPTSYHSMNPSTSSPMMAFGETSIPTSAYGSPPERVRIRPSLSASVESVLESSASVDDDDETDAVPGLDSTFVTAASSLQDMEEDEGGKSITQYASDDNDDDDGSISDQYQSLHLIHRNGAFDLENEVPMKQRLPRSSIASPTSPDFIMLSFRSDTTVSDLKYFAERGCIVPLLQALNSTRLVTQGTRMLADYAKMPDRRGALASNRRILEFVQRTMMQMSDHAGWLGREYAVETIRSLTSTEESDQHLMNTPRLLNTLALVARGGPFVTHVDEAGIRTTIPLASDKARLHSCIAIMNLSCGKANKIEIAKVPEVLEAMRDVMMSDSKEARLKATTCIKNLSNADANDRALLSIPGLVEALGYVADVTCSPITGATTCTTNACLALMNLSISKGNKNHVFRSEGVMDSLMAVLNRTGSHASSREARVKACSALSNLAIGYDNKIPMFSYPGFVDTILDVIRSDTGNARTKACSILWSFAAEIKNQVPVVNRGDILPVLVKVAEDDGITEARFKCVAALTLLAESLENAIPLLQSGALVPLMDILHEAGSDPTQWKGQTASWCVGFFMNIAQSDEAVPILREAGVVELLAPLLTLDHYQSLKAAMAVTFVCRYDEGDETYNLLRKTENVIPKIISLLHNTLSGRGGNGYKYGVFTLRSSVGCIAALASGPDFMKERIATDPVFESLLQVLSDFCVDGGTPGAIVGGGRDDTLSATLAVRALHSLTRHLIPTIGSSSLLFGRSMEDRLLVALESFELCTQDGIKEETKQLATDAIERIRGGQKAFTSRMATCAMVEDGDVGMGEALYMTNHCCVLDTLPRMGGDFFQQVLMYPNDGTLAAAAAVAAHKIAGTRTSDNDDARKRVRTFLLSDSRSGRRFAVPTDPTGGRAFNDTRVWCYRRGRFCLADEEPDPNFQWNDELQRAYEEAIAEFNETPIPA